MRASEIIFSALILVGLVLLAEARRTNSESGSSSASGSSISSASSSEIGSGSAIGTSSESGSSSSIEEDVCCGIPPCGDFTIGRDELHETSFQVNETVTYTCAPGHVIQGNNANSGDIKCQDNCTFTNLPICELVRCDAPEEGMGTVPVTAGTLIFPQTFSYQCLEGHSTTDNLCVQCTSDGNLSSLPPVCAPISCGFPPCGTNTEPVPLTPVSFPSSFTYSCIEGFTSSDTMETFCTADGTFTLIPPPQCTEIRDCSLSPCNDGECTENEDGGITCTCDTGFTGTFCNVEDFCCGNLTLGAVTVGLYPFGDVSGDADTGGQDDGCLASVSHSVTMFGIVHLTLFVCQDGIISLSQPMPAFNIAPFPQNSGVGVIAPYAADGNSGLGGAIWHRGTTNATLLNQISFDVNSVFRGDFNATFGLIATWQDIKAFGSTNQETNTFQAVVVTDDVETYAIYTYDHIDWTMGTASTVPAQVGFDAGDGENFLLVPGSRTPEIINVDDLTNIGIPGKYMFRLDGAEIELADLCSNPCGDTECINQPESETFTCVA